MRHGPQHRETKKNYLLSKEKSYGKSTDLFDFKMLNMKEKKNENLEMLFNKPNIILFLKTRHLK